jgi:lysozyme
VARKLGLALLVGVVFAVPARDALGGQVAYIDGVDVSHFQGTPDWAAGHADGVHFAFIKATEGRTFVDDDYATNSSQADAAGIPFGAYHFAAPDKTADDARLEADHFLDVAALAGRQLLPVLDLETDGGLGTKALKRWAKAWLARVEDLLGVEPIIYTTPAFWRDEMGDSRWFADNGYRLWIAHWGADAPNVPAANWSGRGWTFWQYDNCGSVDGFDGCVDLDHYSGSSLGAVKIKNNR